MPRTAWYSPAALQTTTTGAPPFWSVRICPGASSSSRQTTCFASAQPGAAETAVSAARLEAIEGPRVVVQYLALQILGQTVRQRARRRVEVEVRVVRGE